MLMINIYDISNIDISLNVYFVLSAICNLPVIQNNNELYNFVQLVYVTTLLRFTIHEHSTTLPILPSIMSTPKHKIVKICKII